MGLTTAMYTGLSGINSNQTRIDTIGNNIANVNTTAFKGSRTLLQSQFSQILSSGTPPTDASGGTNPLQIGLGSVVGATQRNWSPGSLELTGLNSDAAIEGNGFFVVRRHGDGAQVYTRDGAFNVNAQNRLVTSDGDLVQGFGVDESFNIVPGVTGDIQIPLGALSFARATQNVRLDGDLSSAGTVATQGSRHVSQALVAGGGAAATATTALTDLRSADEAGVPLLAAGNTITVRGVSKGQRDLPDQTFVVGTTGSTLGDFVTWLEGVSGIQTTDGLPGSPGVRIEDGALVIEGNAGVQNAFDISLGDFSSDNTATANPFAFTRTQEANGESVFTAYTIYDSLGAPTNVQMTFALQSTPDSGPVWRYYVESAEADGGRRALGSGTVTFDAQGNFVSTEGNQFTLQREANGAVNPLAFAIDLSGMNGLSTDTSSALLAEQDGFPPGTLSAFAIGNDGTISGTFSNGLTQTLGQLAVATFANPAGLVSTTDNQFVVGPNSGAAQITTAGAAGAGRIVSGALELSNVDLSAEFINLITSSTGFQASSRVISAANDLLNQLLLITR